MNSQELISFVRNQSFVDTNQITDPQMLTYANFAYKRVINVLNGVDDMVADIFTSNFIAGQNEYILAKPDPSQGEPGISKISKVSVNYGNKWVQAKPISIRGNASDDFTELDKNSSETSPVYITFDSSIFVFPSPKSTVIGGIRMYGNIDALDLTLDTNSMLVLDTNWTYAVALAMLEMVEKGRGQTEKKNDAISEFSRYTNELIDTYTNRNKEPVTSGVMSLNI